MDSSDTAKVVMKRISEMEPEHIANKIIKHMYFQELSAQEMIRLALAPDAGIHKFIQNAKTALLLASPPISPPINPTPLSDPSFQLAPFLPVSPRPFSGPTALFPVLDPYLDPHNNLPLIRVPDESGPSTFQNEYYRYKAAFDNVSIRGARNTPCLTDHFPVKTCHYFLKGFCKHGSNCRYLHGEPPPQPLVFGGHGSYEDDHVFPPGSLEKLELEIAELLKSRRRQPVSIASLPMIYYETYGKILQAEGYLTESQRHGKAGYSLTKLLARLKNSIRLIDRPHGQHAVILAEDASKYMEMRGERNDPGPIVSDSRQIYLTFPPESTFSEDDVANYFSTFGPVQDVRIPPQEKRMFGFVSFDSVETANLVLSKGNPHYVCGARVLVKQYREKSKSVERKYLENFDHPVYYHHSQPTDIDSEAQTSWDQSRMFRRQLREEQEYALDREALRLSQLRLAGRLVPNPSCFGYSINQPRLPEDHSKVPSIDRFSYLFNSLKIGSTSNDTIPKYPVNNCGDQESAQGISLPENHFASAAGSSISAVI
ncbi:hypothetical protein ABFS83_13G159400 [Erythranthe nasuta]